MLPPMLSAAPVGPPAKAGDAFGLPHMFLQLQESWSVQSLDHAGGQDAGAAVSPKALSASSCTCCGKARTEHGH